MWDQSSCRATNRVHAPHKITQLLDPEKDGELSAGPVAAPQLCWGAASYSQLAA